MKALLFRLPLAACLFLAATLLTSCYSDPYYGGPEMGYGPSSGYYPRPRHYQPEGPPPPGSWRPVGYAPPPGSWPTGNYHGANHPPVYYPR